MCVLHTAWLLPKFLSALLTPIRNHSNKLIRGSPVNRACRRCPGEGPDLRGSKYLLYQHTRDDEDSQGHNGDHHQGGDGLLFLAGGHHSQEVGMLTARTNVPRMAAGEERNVSTLF